MPSLLASAGLKLVPSSLLENCCCQPLQVLTSLPLQPVRPDVTLFIEIPWPLSRRAFLEVRPCLVCRACPYGHHYALTLQRLHAATIAKLVREAAPGHVRVAKEVIDLVSDCCIGEFNRMVEPCSWPGFQKWDECCSTAIWD